MVLDCRSKYDDWSRARVILIFPWSGEQIHISNPVSLTLHRGNDDPCPSPEILGDDSRLDAGLLARFLKKIGTRGHEQHRGYPIDLLFRNYHKHYTFQNAVVQILGGILDSTIFAFSSLLVKRASPVGTGAGRDQSRAAVRGAGDREALFASVPGREGAAVEEGLGGPFAEVDGESDAVAVVAREDHHVFVARMAAEDGAHFFGDENRAAPAVRDAHGGKSRGQMADAVFEPAQAVHGFAPANIIAAQIVRAVFGGLGAEGSAKRRAVGGGDEAGAEDDAIRFEQASPQIGKVEGVKRAARGEADGFELRGGQRGGGKRKGEVRLCGGAQRGRFQGGGGA